MHEGGRRIYGDLPPAGNQTRVMQLYIAEPPRYHYDPILVTWEHFNLTTTVHNANCIKI